MNYEKELEKAIQHAEKVKLKQELSEVRHANDIKKKPLSFSKIAVIFIFVNCLIIELYSMFAMFWLNDLSSLGSLIAAVVGQCISLVSYMYKAKSENCQGGITYETTMAELVPNVEIQQEDDSEDDGAVG